MKIVADENIPFVGEGFGELGDVVLMHGRAIGADDVRDAGMLIVRSVTKVDAALLDGAAVRFVGTCTIGTDHLDLDYLGKRGIAVASAPGSNATSVAEYIVAVMLQLAHRHRVRLADMTIGIIGVGNVGSRVEKRARALGMNVLLNDPPLQRQTGDPKYRPLEEVLAGADVVTLHVPLEKGGPDPTWHLADREFLRRMKPGIWLFNSSRGAVHETSAVLEARTSGRLDALYLDVWENEPDIDVELLKAADVASPHICGYSADGKVAGVVMVQHAAGAFLGVNSDWDPSAKLPPPALAEAAVSDGSRDAEDVMRELVLATYDYEGDDRRIREMLDMPAAGRPKHFDALRKDYPCRREFHNTDVTLGVACGHLGALLEGVGFNVT
ncbi:MAG TPA: 4-phosphoerythronate dehydrogenase [Planctomycetota bacterium]|nr:4-phosphoerythronate dehydrogenase [Planctomycetota bacterium]